MPYNFEEKKLDSIFSWLVSHLREACKVETYKATKTRVKTRCGLTQYFNIEVGLHQGSTLSPLLFIIIMDVLASSIQRDPPWAMLFADDLVLCEESRLEVEQQLDRWREVLEENGLRISWKKIEYLRQAGSREAVCLAGVPIPCTTHQLIQVLGINNRSNRWMWSRWR